MIYTESTVIVDVVKTGGSEWSLSVKAEEMYLAFLSGVVVRRWTDTMGTHITHLSDARKYNGSYYFTFANGDMFTASSGDAYPKTETCVTSAYTAQPLVVALTYDNDTSTWSSPVSANSIILELEKGRMVNVIANYTLFPIWYDQEDEETVSFVYADHANGVIKEFLIEDSGDDTTVTVYDYPVE